MNTLIFDVDGVICDRGKKIDPEFSMWLKDFLINKQFHWVTGSIKERTIDQIGQDLYDMCKLSFHCLGNQIWINDHEVLINQFTLSQEEIDFLMSLINKSPFPTKTGNHIEQRKGSVNLSIPGRWADTHIRQAYVDYDNTSGERLKFVELIENNLPRFNAYIGGDVSIDICLKNCNKSQVVTLIGNPALFFGDRMYKYGIDVPLKHVCHDYRHIKNGFRETWEILKSL